MQESYTFFETLAAVRPVLYLFTGIIVASALFFFLTREDKPKPPEKTEEKK